MKLSISKTTLFSFLVGAAVASSALVATYFSLSNKDSNNEAKNGELENCKLEKTNLQKSLDDKNKKDEMEEWRQKEGIKWLNKSLEKPIINFVKEGKEEFLGSEEDDKIQLDIESEHWTESGYKVFKFLTKDGNFFRIGLENFKKNLNPTISLELIITDDNLSKKDKFGEMGRWFCAIDTKDKLSIESDNFLKSETVKKFLKKFGLDNPEDVTQTTKLEFKNKKEEVNKNIRAIFKNCLKSLDFATYDSTKSIIRSLYTTFNENKFNEEEIEKLFQF